MCKIKYNLKITSTTNGRKFSILAANKKWQKLFHCHIFYLLKKYFKKGNYFVVLFRGLKNVSCCNPILFANLSFNETRWFKFQIYQILESLYNSFIFLIYFGFKSFIILTSTQYCKDTEPLYNSLCVLTCITSFNEM